MSECYDPVADFARSIDECYRVIRARMAAGGVGYSSCGSTCAMRRTVGGQSVSSPFAGWPLQFSCDACTLRAVRRLWRRPVPRRWSAPFLYDLCPRFIHEVTRARCGRPGLTFRVGSGRSSIAGPRS
jgi:hypothetical protein